MRRARPNPRPWRATGGVPGDPNLILRHGSNACATLPASARATGSPATEALRHALPRPLCAACERGTRRAIDSYECVACSPNRALSSLYIGLVALALLAIIGVVVFLTISDGGQEAAVDVVITMIAVNHFVIVASASSFPLQWPPFVLSLMSAMSLLSASAAGESAFSVDCVTRTSTTRPAQTWGLITVCAPPALIAASLLLWKIVSRCKAQAKYMKVHFPVTVLIILILGHPTICKGAFRLMACRNIGGRPFLEIDMDVSCWSFEYRAWCYGLALPSLLVFGLGIPTFYLWRMYHFVSAGKLQQERPVYGFLFSGYIDDRWWYELWNTVRKALFTGSPLRWDLSARDASLGCAAPPRLVRRNLHARFHTTTRG